MAVGYKNWSWVPFEEEKSNRRVGGLGGAGSVDRLRYVYFQFLSRDCLLYSSHPEHCRNSIWTLGSGSAQSLISP